MNVKKANKDDTSNKKSRTTLFLVSALVAAGGLALVGFLLSRSSDGQVVLQVGNERITKAEEQRYKDSAKSMGLGDENVRGELIEYLKNKHIAQKYTLPMNTLFIDEQWSNVVSEHSVDSFAAKKLFTHKDEDWAYVLKYNKLYHVLSRSLDKDALVGALYHIPFSGSDKQYAQQLANDIKATLQKGNVATLEQDQQLLKDVYEKTPQASASKTGAYLLFSDSSGLRMGGTFGVRGGTVPYDMTAGLFKGKLPMVSDVAEVNASELYVIHVVAKIEADESFPDTIITEKEGVRVVEYDK